MAGNAVLVIANKHGVVVFGRLEDHTLVNKCVYNLSVNLALIDEVSEDAVEILAGRRQYKGFPCLMRMLRQGLAVELKQIFHRVDIALSQKLANKTNGIPTDLLVLMIPKIAPDCDLLALV